MLVLAACGGNSTTSGTPASNVEVNNSTNEAGSNGQAGEEVEAAEEPQQSEEPVVEEPKDEAYKVGDKFILGDWEVTLDSFSFDQKVSDEYFSSSADEGNKFLVLNYTVTNQGTAADNFTAMFGGVNIKALFQDKYEYSYTVTMIDGDLSNESIKPLSSKTGFVVMEVPDLVASSEDSLILQLSKDDAKATLQVR